MKKNIPFLFSISFIVMLFGCKKEEKAKEQIDTGKLIMFIDEKFANAEDTLMAVYTRPGGSENYSLFGSYDSKGMPQKVKEVVLHKNDTAINYIMDDSNRVKTIFCTVNGTKDKNVFFIGYNGNTITMMKGVFNWVNNTHNIEKVYTINRDNFETLNTHNFSAANSRSTNLFGSFGHPSLCAIGFSPALFLLQCPAGINNEGAAFNAAKNFAGALGSVLVANAAYVATMCAAGTLLGPFQPVVCAAAAIDAIRITGNALNNEPPKSRAASCSYEQLPSSNGSSSQEPKVVTKESPQASLTGTELDKNYGLNVGYSTGGPVNTFDAICAEDSKAQLKNLVIDLKTYRGFGGIVSCSFKCTYYFAYGDNNLGGPWNYSNPKMAYFDYNPQVDLYSIYFSNAWTYGGYDRLVGSVLADGRSFAGIFYFNAGYSCNDGLNHVALTQTNIYINSVN